MRQTRRNARKSKGGAWGNWFKKKSTIKNNLGNLRKHFGYGSELNTQRLARLGKYKNGIDIKEEEMEEYVKPRAKRQNNNLNKSFDDILIEIKDYLFANGQIINEKKSDTEGKKNCTVYWIGINRNVIYKIRTCPEYPDTLEIKHYDGRWKMGPFDKGLEKLIGQKLIENHLNRPFIAILYEMKYDDIDRVISKKSSEENCTDYLIYVNNLEKYTIRTCPEYPDTLKIKAVDGKWQTGPYVSYLENLIAKNTTAKLKNPNPLNRFYTKKDAHEFPPLLDEVGADSR